MLLSDFDYNLPEERIAQTPIEPRNASRLMVLNPQDKSIQHKHFYDLKEFLVPGDTLIFNDTRVLPARLILMAIPQAGELKGTEGVGLSFLQ